jgi:integrase/recombinase XerC/integrase/recombinase XerD
MKKPSEQSFALEKISYHQLIAKLTYLIEEFVASLDVASASRTTYKRSLSQFFKWLAPKKISHPTRETILAYKESLDKKGLRPYTRASYLVAVRKFFEWSEGMQLYPNIARGVKGARRGMKTHQKDSLSIDHIKKLLTAINRNTLQGLRDYALINLLVRTGLRLIEIARADIGDIDPQENGEALLWVRGKGRDGKDEFVVLTQETLSPILDYIAKRARRSPKMPLFSSLSDRNFDGRITTFSLSRLIKGHFRECGLSSRRITAHSLRHTFGVLSITAGASLYEVQLAMRHAAASTTEIYLGDIEQAKRREASPERRLSELLKSRGIENSSVDGD